MKCNIILTLAFYIVTFCTFSVESHGPWKYYPYYPVPAYPPIPKFQGFGQPNTKPTNICTECLNRWANFAKIFNIPNYSQFGNQNHNNKNLRTTILPPPKTTTSVPFIEVQSFSTLPPPTVQPITQTLQTTRPPIPRRSTIKPVIKQPDPNSSERISVVENKGFISTEDRIRAILKTTNAPVTNQQFFTYPEIKNSLNHMDYQLGDIREPNFDGLKTFFAFGR